MMFRQPADKRLVGVWENEPEDRDIRHENDNFLWHSQYTAMYYVAGSSGLVITRVQKRPDDDEDEDIKI